MNIFLNNNCFSNLYSKEKVKRRTLQVLSVALTFTFFFNLPAFADPLDKVAIAIYTSGEISSAQGAPLLAGEFGTNSLAVNSDFDLSNENDVLNDIIKSGNEVDSSSNTDLVTINGVIYSSTGAALVSVEPVSNGGTSNVPNNAISVKLTNTTNSGDIDMAFTGQFLGLTLSSMTGNTSSISNLGNSNCNANNRANFALTADVIEDTVNNYDDSGSYQGSLKIVVTVL